MATTTIQKQTMRAIVKKRYGPPERVLTLDRGYTVRQSGTTTS